MRPIKKTSTDQSVVIRIIDATDGTPETGVVYNTTGIDLWYRREGAIKTSITEATLAAVDSIHSDGGVIHIGDGYYRLDLPDAAVATGCNGVMVGGTVTGMIVIGDYTALVDYDPYDSANLGVDALADWINGGRLDAILDIIAADVVNIDGDAMRGTNSANTVVPPSVAEFNARTILAASYFDPAVDTVVTVTGVTNQVSADVTAISGDTVAANNLEATYDGTGYTEDSAPAKQSQLANIANIGSAINTVAESFTKSGAEIETLTYTSTKQLDGVYHEVEDIVATGLTDVYYEADVGANGIPSSITWHGYVQGQGDFYGAFAYNFTDLDWDQLGIIVGASGTTQVTESWDLITAHVSSENKVRLRFYSSDGSKIGTDQVLFSYSVVARSVGYSLGAIWVDSAGTAGTENYVNGTADNPCPWANALTISASLGIKKFSIANGDTVTLSAAADNYTFIGYEWNLALGGQSISGSFFEHASVSGTATGTSYRFIRCKIALSIAASLEAGGMKECVLGSAGITFSAAGTYLMADCSAANDSGFIDFEVAAENKNLYMSAFCGDIEFRNFGHATGVHKIMLTGQGHVTFNSNCSAATAADIFDVHGMFHITDSVAAGWGGTTNEEARIDSLVINAECDTALTDYDGPTNTEMVAAFTEIKGATFSATDTLEALRDRGDAAWTTGAGGTPPDLLQSTTIATLASQTSFTLTAGSTDNDAYNDQIAIITDQVTSEQKAVASISDYVGATKTITLSADPTIFTIATGDSIAIVAATGAAGSGATASEVWGYTTRILTAGTNLNDPTAAAIRTEIDNNSTQLTAIVTDTGTTIPGTITTMQSNVTDILADTGTTGVLLASTATSAKLVDDVLDESVAATEHNVVNSLGRRVREISGPVIITGTSPDTGGTANTSIRIELNGDASSVDGAYDPACIVITAGAGAGQSRQIFEYVGATKYAYVNRDWKVIPDNTSEYSVLAHSGCMHVNEGLAQAGSISTITLNTLAASSNDIYNAQLVFIVAGAGADQSRRIDDYNGSTKVATVNPDWVVAPNSGSVYAIIPESACDQSAIDDILVDTGTTIPATLAGLNTTVPDAAGTAATLHGVTDGKIDTNKTELDGLQGTDGKALISTDGQDLSGTLGVDTKAISGSTDAADKLEASAETILIGAASAGTLSTTQMTTNLTEATDDHFLGRIVIFTSGVLLRQATDITDYTGATKLITMTALTEAPSAADTFIIV